MATKIRLQRHGRKRYAFYPIVIADSRAPRDGKFIERIGSYNPNTNPATISLNFERALYWVSVGAQPTDTVRRLLSNEGVLLKKHLLGGVKKGAFTEEEANRRFEEWKKNKEAQLNAKKEQLSNDKKQRTRQRLSWWQRRKQKSLLLRLPRRLRRLLRLRLKTPRQQLKRLLLRNNRIRIASLWRGCTSCIPAFFVGKFAKKRGIA